MSGPASPNGAPGVPPEDVREERWTLVRRVAAAFLVFTFPVMKWVGVQGGIALSLGLVMTVAGAILLGPELATMWGALFAGILWEGRAGARKPMYGIAESLVKSERYDEARAAYEKIIEEFPEEPKAYVDFIRMAALRLRDGDMAKEVYDRAMATLPTPEARGRVESAYTQIIREYLRPKREAKTIGYHKQDGPPHR